MDGEVAPSTEPAWASLLAQYGTDEAFLRSAVRLARSRHRRRRHPRWVAVMDTFACGSTVAALLCRRFGFDPDEEVFS